METENAEDRRESLMARAIEEAARARGRTSPNPLVGAVVTRDGEVVGTGYHASAGEPHAEIRALEAVDGPTRGTTMYVSLEPCCHHGRTPPCTQAMIDAGVERVYVAMKDPDPRVCGGGLRQLEEAGIEVRLGLLEEEARELNRPYVTSIAKGRPFVAMKYAMTADGKIATRTGESKWITGEASRRRVHRMRNEYDAVLVGTGTLLADDPRLTCRIQGGRDPVRAGLDARLEAPLTSRLFDPDRSDATTIVYTSSEAPAGRRNELRDRGIEVVEVPADEASGHLMLDAVLEDLHQRELLSVMVEGGGRLDASFLERGLCDRLHVFLAPKIAGGESAMTPVEGSGVESMADAIPLEPVELDRFEDDLLMTFDVQDS